MVAAVRENSFLDFLEPILDRFMVCDSVGVMGHIEIKEIQYAPCGCQALLGGGSGVGLGAAGGSLGAG